ncbi:Malate transporter, aliminium toerance [Akanthomyces lecanii RCEF 1005]|uniref:Malate transporter, aliminium toerance n=1 Tax=Akanthomyces lecanii RCEF 1005 TaxID=1081108 RepID=A0A168KCV9_CORDF|nr:Malate transporter, aliminium toerance [Akanthomyces lecanii RCEF 1005]
MASSNPLGIAIRVLWGDVQTNQPWQRILKYSIACVAALILAILPRFNGRENFLIPMVVVFGHPGQRMGLMIESLLMILLGALLGVVWSLLGLYLASLVFDGDRSAAYAIRGVFLLVAALLHGFIRSHSPRLFNFVLFMLVAVIITVQAPTSETVALFSNIYVPVCTGAAVSLLGNLALFPELSSSYLGDSAITTISEAMEALSRSTYWFVTPGGDCEEVRQHRARLYSSTSRKSRASAASLPFLKRLVATRRWRAFASQFPNPFKSSMVAGQSKVPLELTSLASLTESKTRIRSKLRACRAAQDEVNFEISLSKLPPDLMRPITTNSMTNLIQGIITVIGACENKFVLLGANNTHTAPARSQTTNTLPNTSQSFRNTPKSGKVRKRKGKRTQHAEDVKPIKEIEGGSVELVEHVLLCIRDPVMDLHQSIKEAVGVLIDCLAYCLEVAKLPSGEVASESISLSDLDAKMDRFADAMVAFDAQSAEALKAAATETDGQALDFMPRMETFLISSFILALRQSAAQIMLMLRHSRTLVELRQQRNSRSRLWLPKFASLGQWLSSSGTEPSVVAAAENGVNVVRNDSDAPTELNSAAAQNASTENMHRSRSGDEELASPLSNNMHHNESRRHTRDSKSASSRFERLRHTAADVLEWAQNSEDLVYSAKLSIALFLVTWPALVPSWNQWYAEVRGIWAPLQLILVFELAIGTSLIVFFIRLLGVVFGGVIGYLSYEIARGNRAAVVAVVLFGIVPSIYIQVATKYVKAGMISIISMAVVALSAVNTAAPGYEVFYKRLVAFIIGGVVAVLIEIFIYPVRARDRLVDSLAAAVLHVQNMQAVIAVGIDHPDRPNFRSRKLYTRFKRARDKAQSCLTAAETYLPSCLTEPRLKGSFKPLAPIYSEIIYVLHQITDRMNSVVQLRREYGSSILEDLNPRVYAYRRNVMGSCNLILFSVHEALTTWLPLPQFLPSARLAQLRLINRVREVLDAESTKGSTSALRRYAGGRLELDESTASIITKRKFLSWNASTSGQMEIIEYLEELTDLVKLLVGVNAFRRGMLETPNYRLYMQRRDGGIEETTPGEDYMSAEAGRRAPNHKLQVDATTEDDEDGGGYPDVSVEAMVGGTRRSRAATVTERPDNRLLERAAQHLQGAKDLESGAGGASEAAVVDDDNAEVEDIPVSLQRVGTRMRENNAAVRSRAFTISSEKRP